MQLALGKCKRSRGKSEVQRQSFQLQLIYNVLLSWHDSAVCCTEDVAKQLFNQSIVKCRPACARPVARRGDMWDESKCTHTSVDDHIWWEGPNAYWTAQRSRANVTSSKKIRKASEQHNTLANFFSMRKLDVVTRVVICSSNFFVCPLIHQPAIHPVATHSPFYSVCFSFLLPPFPFLLFSFYSFSFRLVFLLFRSC